ncbi:pH regulation protein F [Aliidiomarina minuta]|uniref:pH regulation protein F n=1 Tax=Aliidiomarina minuta TaxID=880057 RepID=A0A432W879_9GAMM|nr:monovalent cation/H+ antiporter complex subunit F [Aliidiomarina minuta]RUO26320.1 pH regulation protein F [Aliidiomarina minuta]
MWWIAALILLLTLLVGLIRVWHGPDRADRMLAAQLFGSTGVALLLVLAQAMQQPALRDVALVLALLAVLAMVAFVHKVKQPKPGGDS